ncbi:nucleoside monophosphate kinase [bacterium]|nr:MAG: nucleoside monophosphate kinase [bacterium]
MGELIILMGPTGSGKSTQGELLAQKLHGVHLSSGHLLREHPSTKHLMESGKLVEADLVEQVVGDVIDTIAQSQPIVLDGFPRTQSNVHWIDTELIKHGRSLRQVILLEVDKKVILERLRQRQRSDDDPAAVERKWVAYDRWTTPVVEHYRDLGHLREVDGAGSPDEVQSRIWEVVQAA